MAPVQALIAVLIAALALGGCASSRVLRDFTTDGCSFFPDGNSSQPQLWGDCCINHDMAYWRGGIAQARFRADDALRECVMVRTGRKAFAGLMYRGVRLTGTPWIPTEFRWGYGWGFGRGYEPLTVDEQQQASEKISLFRRTTPEP